MTDNEIIKALECCCVSECDECPYDEQTACVEIMKEGALALINRQKAEVERLNIRNKVLTAITKNYDWKFAKAKSEAIKEFAERLKDNYNVIFGRKAVSIAEIDNLLKEMTEEKERDA